MSKSNTPNNNLLKSPLNKRIQLLTTSSLLQLSKTKEPSAKNDDSIEKGRSADKIIQSTRHSEVGIQPPLRPNIHTERNLTGSTSSKVSSSVAGPLETQESVTFAFNEQMIKENTSQEIQEEEQFTAEFRPKSLDQNILPNEKDNKAQNIGKVSNKERTAPSISKNSLSALVGSGWKSFAQQMQTKRNDPQLNRPVFRPNPPVLNPPKNLNIQSSHEKTNKSPIRGNMLIEKPQEIINPPIEEKSVGILKSPVGTAKFPELTSIKILHSSNPRFQSYNQGILTQKSPEKRVPSTPRNNANTGNQASPMPSFKDFLEMRKDHNRINDLLSTPKAKPKPNPLQPPGSAPALSFPSFKGFTSSMHLEGLSIPKSDNKEEKRNTNNLMENINKLLKTNSLDKKMIQEPKYKENLEAKNENAKLQHIENTPKPPQNTVPRQPLSTLSPQVVIPNQLQQMKDSMVSLKEDITNTGSDPKREKTSSIKSSHLMSDLPVIPEYPEITPRILKKSKQTKSESANQSLQNSLLKDQRNFPESSIIIGRSKNLEESDESEKNADEDEEEEEEENDFKSGVIEIEEDGFMSAESDSEEEEEDGDEEEEQDDRMEEENPVEQMNNSNEMKNTLQNREQKVFINLQINEEEESESESQGDIISKEDNEHEERSEVDSKQDRQSISNSNIRLDRKEYETEHIRKMNELIRNQIGRVNTIQEKYEEENGEDEYEDSSDNESDEGDDGYEEEEEDDEDSGDDSEESEEEEEKQAMKIENENVNENDCRRRLDFDKLAREERSPNLYTPIQPTKFGIQERRTDLGSASSIKSFRLPERSEIYERANRMPRQQYSHEQLLVPQNTPLQANRNRNVAVEFFKKKLNEIETKVWHVKAQEWNFEKEMRLLKTSLKILNERVDHLKDFAEDKCTRHDSILSLTSSELNQIFSGDD